tara:strand:+ start:288 stop:500 length:213 start_codon:yes stop_codon:yes gene_type:complete
MTMQTKSEAIKALFENLEAPWLVCYDGIEVIEFEPGEEGWLELSMGYCIPMVWASLVDLAIVHEHIIDMS